MNQPPAIESHNLALRLRERNGKSGILCLYALAKFDWDVDKAAEYMDSPNYKLPMGFLSERR